MKRAWFLAHSTADPSQLPETGWRQVNLPHQWTLDGIEAEVGWYRLEFPEVQGRRWAKIRADYFCEAWIGNAYQGSHTGYFEPWTLEIPPEEQLLLLRVAAPKEEVGTVWPRFKRQIKGVFGHHDCRPGGSTSRGQERGSGGLWGGVSYLRTGEVALLHLNWRTIKAAAGWKLWIEAEMDAGLKPGAPSRQETIEFTLTPENFSGETFTALRTFEVGAGCATYEAAWDLPEMLLWEVWERGFPHLYELRASITNQVYACHVGFRSFEMDGDWLVLNGNRLFLRGTNIIPTQWLSTYDAEAGERDVQLVREAHLNAVRVHAHVTHPAFYDACDRQGVLVWQDFPLQWGYAIDEPFAQEAVRQAKAMVKQFGDHPSIYQWCAHNEPTHNRHSLDPLLAAALRQADATRLVKEVSNFQEHVYPGWYWGYLRDFLAIPGAPLPSEFGAQALPRADLLRETLGDAAWPPDWETWVYHNFQPEQTFRVAEVAMGESLEEFVSNSQAYQARLIQFSVEAYRRAKGQVTGYFQFMLVEPWSGITWAVLDVTREPKAGFFALKAASSPVLLSLVPFRDQLETGAAPLSEAWVINDLDQALDVRVSLRLEGPVSLALFETEALSAHHIEKQSAHRIFQIGEYYEASRTGSDYTQMTAALHQLVSGEYRLVGEVFEGGTLLSRNELAVTYLEPIVPAGQGW